jgi:hypothetical protein
MKTLSPSLQEFYLTGKNVECVHSFVPSFLPSRIFVQVFINMFDEFASH